MIFEQEIIESTLNSKKITTQKLKFTKEESLSVFGDTKNHILTFDLYDGFGFSEPYNGKTYVIEFPTIDFINKCTEMEQTIREFNGLQDEEPVTIPNIVHAYFAVTHII